MEQKLNIREEIAVRQLLENKKKEFDILLCRDIKEELYQQLVETIIQKGYIEKKGGILLCTSKFINEFVDNDVDWIDEYRKLFAVQRDRMGRKEDIANAMRKFIKETKFTKRQIILATKEYISVKAEENYLYLLGALNFIQKGKLEEYCELIKFREEKDQELGETKLTNGNILWG